MATKPKNLRDVNDTIDAVKRYADKQFGFHAFRVTPLEADGNDPSAYYMFEVCSVQYQVNDGKLSIYEEAE